MAQTEYRKELEDLVLTVIHEGASDLHLIVGRHPTIRVSGELIPLVKKPVLEADDTQGLIKELLSEANYKVFLESKEVDFSFSFEKRSGMNFSGSGYQRASCWTVYRLMLMIMPLPPRVK